MRRRGLLATAGLDGASRWQVFVRVGLQAFQDTNGTQWNLMLCDERTRRVLNVVGLHQTVVAAGRAGAR